MLLQNLQLEFADAIVADEQDIDFILPVKNMRIYQNNVISTLTKALHNTYPLIVKLIGDDFFRLTAKEYIKRYPSRSGNLNDYGQYFSDFLVEYEPVKELIYLADVAQFEWTCHTLLSASTHSPFDATLLKNIAPEQYEHIHFYLHPASRVMKFYYPLLRIIDLCKGEINDTIDLGEEGVNILIIRLHEDISLIPLSESDYTFLSALQDNVSLAAALEATINIDPTFQLDEKLTAWIQDQTIVDCQLFA